MFWFYEIGIKKYAQYIAVGVHFCDENTNEVSKYKGNCNQYFGIEKL